MKFLLSLMFVLTPFCLTAETYVDEQAEASKREDPKYIEKVPSAYRTESGVFLVVEENNPKEELMKCRLINRSGRPISFSGFGIRAPLPDIQILRHGTWKTYDEDLWLCGNGMYSPVLPSNRSVCFWASKPKNITEPLMRYKLTIEREDRSLTIYSDPINIGRKLVIRSP